MNRLYIEFKLLKASRVALSTLVLGVGFDAFAQEDDEDSLFQLSPFVVESSDSEGYRAASTLAGTRLKTELKDLATSISVLTDEFLEDTGSTDLEDVLVYSTGFEVGGTGGNYSAANATGNGFDNETAQLDNLVVTRVRGLAGATQTRNYFISPGIPADAYNVERIVLNRGPNAVLFGLGSPGGVVNTQTLRPMSVDSNEVALQFDQFGSQRYTLDVNRVFAEEKFSIRVAALYEDEKFEQEQAFNRDRRFYAIAQYKPFERTTIRASFEDGSIDSNNPRNIPPVDLVTRWFQTDKPSQNGQTDGITNVNRTELSTLGDWFQNIGLRVDASTGASAGDAVRGLQDQRGVSGAFGAFMGTPALEDTRNRLSFYPRDLPDGSGTYEDRLLAREGVRLNELNWSFTPVFTDRSLFDYREILIDGDTKREEADLRTYNVSFEQLFLDGDLGIELSYDEQGYDRFRVDGINPGNQRSNAIYVDATTVEPDGRNNENFSRPVILSSPRFNRNWNENSSTRATAFYNVDFAEKLDGRLGEILGKHSFTALYSSLTQDSKNGTGRPYVVDETTTFLANRQPGNLGHDQNRLSVVYYLGDRLEDATDPTQANITTGMAGQIPQSFPATIHTHRTDTFTPHTVLLSPDAYTGADLNRTEVDSAAFIWQGRLFGDNVIPMVGWRRDNAETFRNGNPPLTPTRLVVIDHPDFVLPDEADTSIDDLETWTYGLVIHTPQFIDEILPAGMELSFHYNESENFQPSSQRFNILGENLAAPGGTTEEYGFTLSMFEGKFDVRATWYETGLVNQNNSQLSGLDGTILADERRFAEAWLNDDVGNPRDAQAAYTRPIQEFLDFVNWEETLVNGVWTVTTDAPNIVSTQDAVSKGFELDLVYNPTKNWRILFNAAQQEAVQSGIGEDYEEYFARRNATLWKNPVMQDFRFQGLNTVENSSLIFDLRLKNAQLTNGRQSDELREWRWNLVTNYAFDEDSALKGFSVGGALRWQDESILGYPVIENPNDPGDFIQNINAPLFGSTETNVDLWLAYRRQLNDDVVMNVRLNVRNVTSDEGLIPLYINPNGQASIFRMEQPRLFQLRTSFEF